MIKSQLITLNIIVALLMIVCLQSNEVIGAYDSFKADVIRDKLFNRNQPLTYTETKDRLYLLSALEPDDKIVKKLFSLSMINDDGCDVKHLELMEEIIKSYTFGLDKSILPTAVTIAKYIEHFLEEQLNHCKIYIGHLIDEALATLDKNQANNMMNELKDAISRQSIGGLNLFYELPNEILEMGILTFMEKNKEFGRRMSKNKFKELYEHIVLNPCKIISQNLKPIAKKYFSEKKDDKLAEKFDSKTLSWGENYQICYDITRDRVFFRRNGTKEDIFDKVYDRYLKATSLLSKFRSNRKKQFRLVLKKVKFFSDTKNQPPI